MAIFRLGAATFGLAIATGPGLAKADFVWDQPHLDAWLTNPQAVIPGAYMPYRQAKPEVRAAVIGYLKDRTK